MGLDECLRDREPKSHPTLITAPRLPEVIEQSRQIGGGDTWSGISHLEFGRIVVTKDPQCDDTFRRRELQRVAEKVAENLRDTQGIDAHGEQLIRSWYQQLHVMRLC